MKYKNELSYNLVSYFVTKQKAKIFFFLKNKNNKNSIRNQVDYAWNDEKKSIFNLQS